MGEQGTAGHRRAQQTMHGNGGSQLYPTPACIKLEQEGRATQPALASPSCTPTIQCTICPPPPHPPFLRPAGVAPK